jgi:glycosyltransferase involved in cell wall biosynthesis
VLPKLMRLIESFSPNIVESHDYKSHLLFFLARLLNPRLRRLKWIAFHHGYTRTSLKVLAYQQLDKVTLRHADRVVTLCEPFAKLLVGRGVRPGNISIISNSVSPQSPPSTDLITATKAAFGLTGSNFVILAVGRLSAEKGQADLLAAISQMRDTGPPNIRVLIAGDGPDRRRLQRQAAPLGSAVIFTGHVRDPWPLYNIAQLFVLPSHSEGSPLAILEAMAARLPIVSTSVGGIPELLQDGQTALLVPPRSPAGLAQAITTMKADEALRLRLAKNALDAVKRHSPFAYTERLLSIYDSTT